MSERYWRKAEPAYRRNAAVRERVDPVKLHEYLPRREVNDDSCAVCGGSWRDKRHKPY